MKHVGVCGEKKVVVVFREVPNEMENCLVVYPDQLESRQHDELMSVVEGIEGQDSNNLADVLNRRQFSDGGNMLTTLHYAKRLNKVPTVNVDLTPVPNQRICLADVNAELHKMQTGNPPPKTDSSHLAESAKNKPWIERSPEEATALNQEKQAISNQVVADQAPVPTGDSPSDIAQGLKLQADLMLADAEQMKRDAEAKLAEAIKLDPSLAPPKRKRGRPAKKQD